MKRNDEKWSSPKPKYYPAICLEGLMKTTKIFSKTVDVPANIRTGHLRIRIKGGTASTSSLGTSPVDT